MKKMIVLILVGIVAIGLIGCTMSSNNADKDKMEIGEEKPYVEPKPEILVSDTITKVNFTFYDDEIGIDDFDGEYIYISTWHDGKSAVIDMEGNYIIPWQEGKLDIWLASEDVFTISYYDNIIHEELNGESDIAAETSYNFYVKDQGFIYDEPQRGLFYGTDFKDGYLMKHGHDGEKEFIIIIDREGNIIREIYPNDEKYMSVECYGKYIYYSNGYNEDGDYKYVYEDIITGEIFDKNPVEIDTSYREFFSEDALIEKNNTNIAIVTDNEEVGLYSLTNGEKLLDLENDMSVSYYLKDTYYVKSIQGDEGYDIEVYDFEGDKLATFFENYKIYKASDSIVYEYGGEAYYWKIGGIE